jgi:hypothetical protein
MPAKSVTVTIATSGTISGPIDKMLGRSVVRIDFPTMTGTALTFLGGDLNTTATMKVIGSESGALSITSPSGRSVTLQPFQTYGYSCLRLVSGTAEATPRLITVHLNDFLG